jgi:hypothetical protein
MFIFFLSFFNRIGFHRVSTYCKSTIQVNRHSFFGRSSWLPHSVTWTFANVQPNRPLWVVPLSFDLVFEGRGIVSPSGWKGVVSPIGGKGFEIQCGNDGAEKVSASRRESGTTLTTSRLLFVPYCLSMGFCWGIIIIFTVVAVVVSLDECGQHWGCSFFCLDHFSVPSLHSVSSPLIWIHRCWCPAMESPLACR